MTPIAAAAGAHSNACDEKDGPTFLASPSTEVDQRRTRYPRRRASFIAARQARDRSATIKFWTRRLTECSSLGSAGAASNLVRTVGGISSQRPWVRRTCIARLPREESIAV